MEADDVWGGRYAAKNAGDGDLDGIGIGTGEKIKLAGKNKFEDVSDGGADADIIRLTDTSDAFFLHDSFSGFYEEVTTVTDGMGNQSAKRVIGIETIEAGGGDDAPADLGGEDTPDAGGGQCQNDDGCCPDDCTVDTDNDCQSECGDGFIGPDETCEGDSQGFVRSQSRGDQGLEHHSEAEVRLHRHVIRGERR